MKALTNASLKQEKVTVTKQKASAPLPAPAAGLGNAEEIKIGEKKGTLPPLKPKKVQPIVDLETQEKEAAKAKAEAEEIELKNK